MSNELTVNAKITRVVRDRGFGFAKDEFEQLYFFHYSAIDPRMTLKFESLREGDCISFIREEGEKGPRAKPRTLKLIAPNVMAG